MDERSPREGDAGTDAAWPTVSGVRHRTVPIDGLTLHVAEAGAVAGRVAGPGAADPILLLHGFPQHWWEYRDVIPALAATHRVIAPDLRGADWTDAPPSGYTVAQIANDVIALLDALGLDAVHLVTHDWSGLVGMRLAFEHPERIRTWLGVGGAHPWIRFTPAMAAGMWRLWFQPLIATPRVGPALLAGGRQRLGAHLLAELPAADRAPFLDRLRDPARASAGSALYRHLILPEMGRMGRGTYRSGTFPMPVRIMVGGDDPVMRPEMLDGWQGHADDLEVVVADRAAHFIVDARPDAVAEHALALAAR